MTHVVIGSDHAGFDLKEKVKSLLGREGHDVEDMGPDNTDSVDYPDYAQKVAERVAAADCLGILICGTGIGISIAANKVKGVRAALCHVEFEAQMSRNHNNANILCMGARVIGEEVAYRLVQTFLDADFEGGRHGRRVDKITALEAS